MIENCIAGSSITCDELTDWFTSASCKTIDDLLPIDRLKLAKIKNEDVKKIVADGRDGGVRFFVECIDYTAAVVRALVDEVDQWNKNECARSCQVVVAALTTEFKSWDDAKRKRACDDIKQALLFEFGDDVSLWSAKIDASNEIDRKFGRRAVINVLVNEIAWWRDEWWRDRRGQVASSLVEVGEWSDDKRKSALIDATEELCGDDGEFDDAKGVAALETIKRALGSSDDALIDGIAKLFTKGAR